MTSPHLRPRTHDPMSSRRAKRARYHDDDEESIVSIVEEVVPSRFLRSVFFGVKDALEDEVKVLLNGRLHPDVSRRVESGGDSAVYEFKIIYPFSLSWEDVDRIQHMKGVCWVELDVPPQASDLEDDDDFAEASEATVSPPARTMILRVVTSATAQREVKRRYILRDAATRRIGLMRPPESGSASAYASSSEAFDGRHLRQVFSTLRANLPIDPETKMVQDNATEGYIRIIFRLLPKVTLGQLSRIAGELSLRHVILYAGENGQLIFRVDVMIP